MTQNVHTTTISYCQNIYDIVGENGIPGIKALVATRKDFNGYGNSEPHKGGQELLYQRHRNDPDILREICVNKSKGIVVTLMDIRNNVIAIFSREKSSIGPLSETFKENFLLTCGLDINGQPLPELDPV